jgi:hypothetical protein
VLLVAFIASSMKFEQLRYEAATETITEPFMRAGGGPGADKRPTNACSAG